MIKLTKEALRAIFPRAPQAVIDAFFAKQDLLTKAGINASRVRMAYFFANIEHECGGFTIPNLTENINYTAARMAQVWPNRFSSAAAVQSKYGTGPGWQKKAFDDIYGRRMGNRPGTSDGSLYIGRGGPQWTGRDGYAALERLTGLPAVADPTVASRHDLQPEVCTAFWTWKNMNRYADAGDFNGCVKAWNGGFNGMADRKAMMAGNDPIIKRLENVNAIAAQVPEPTKPAVTKEDVGKVVIAAGEATIAKHGVDEGWGVFEWSMFGLGSALFIAAVYLAWRYGWPAFKAWRQKLPSAPTAADIRDLIQEHKPATAEALPAPEFVEAPTKRLAARRAPRKPAAKPKGKTKRTTKKRKAA